MRQEEWELTLHGLSMIEQGGKDEDYKKYILLVRIFLEKKNLFDYEDEILKRHGLPTMEEVQAKYKLRYTSAGEKLRDERKIPVWYNTWTNYTINPGELFYKMFFAYKIRHCNLDEIDPFLDYQLSEVYQGDFSKFSRFLTLTLREYGQSLISPDNIQTAQEWAILKPQEQKPQLQQDESSLRIKGRPKRVADDKLTALNQEQIVLLIHYLKNAKAFYPGEYLTNKQAGLAFHILTGYSVDTIRQKLASHEIDTIINTKNLADLSAFLVQVQKQIESALKNQTGPTGI